MRRHPFLFWMSMFWLLRHFMGHRHHHFGYSGYPYHARYGHHDYI